MLKIEVLQQDPVVRRPRMVIIHPNETCRATLKEYLTSRFLADVFTTYDTSEALLLSTRITPDMIIIGNCPPKTDGLNLARKCVSSNIANPENIVLLTPEDTPIPEDLGNIAVVYDRRELHHLFEDLNRLFHLNELNRQVEELHKEVSALSEASRSVQNQFVVSINRILELRVPWVVARVQAAGHAADYLAGRMKFTPLDHQELLLAVNLCEAGRLFLPPERAQTPISRIRGEEIEDVRDAPYYAYEVLCSSPELTRVAGLVKYQYENCDGSGFPEGLDIKTIPIGSQILRIIGFFRESLDLPSLNLSDTFILNEIENLSGKWFNSELVSLFREYLENEADSCWNPWQVKVLCDEVVPDMVLAQDLFGSSGDLLLKANNTLTPKMVEYLKSRPYFAAGGTGIVVQRGFRGVQRVEHKYISRMPRNRQEPRCRYASTVQYRSAASPGSGFRESILRDISSSGLLLETYESHPLSTKLEVRIFLAVPDSHKDAAGTTSTVHAIGEVRWVRRLGQHRYYIGLQLKQMDAGNRERLDSYLEMFS